MSLSIRSCRDDFCVLSRRDCKGRARRPVGTIPQQRLAGLIARRAAVTHDLPGVVDAPGVRTLQFGEYDQAGSVPYRGAVPPGCGRRHVEADPARCLARVVDVGDGGQAGIDDGIGLRVAGDRADAQQRAQQEGGAMKRTACGGGGCFFMA